MGFAYTAFVFALLFLYELNSLLVNYVIIFHLTNM